MPDSPENKRPDKENTPPEKPNPRRPLPPSAPPQRSGTMTFFLILVVVLIIALLVYSGSATKRTKITWGDFMSQFEEENIESVTILGERIKGKFKETPPLASLSFESKETTPKEVHEHFSTEIPPFALADPELDQQFRRQLGGNYTATRPPDYMVWMLTFSMILTFGVLFAVWMMVRRTREQMMGGMVSGFNRSPAKRYEMGSQEITFDDVAGLEGVKNELKEIVDYLKDPDKFIRMGARVPKGTLLVGPPGSGKTLLARAVAGEAEVPFFSINGSEFIQMFVGVGASRVRDLFNTAKEHSPAILFVDEIDAVGRHRGTGLGGGHDEREQTLNQILSEMDGFTPSESVMVMAATNRPDVLDPALLRPGRFDRHVTVDRPTLKGRIAIFKVHIKGIPLEEDVDLERLAKGTVGFTGADIRNLVNEATLWATRKGKEKVEMSDFNFARDKVMIGAQREEILSEDEKRKTACHEAGHTLVAWFQPIRSQVHKVSIIPRGRSLGATQVLPEEDQLGINETQLNAQLAFAMGGRCAEKLFFDEFSSGAEQDLKQATQLARRMVVHWGMSERLGPIAFRVDESHPFLGREMSEAREYSDETARVIDEEVVRILRDAYDRAAAILQEHRDKLEILSRKLEEEEELEETRIIDLIGPSPFRKEEKPEVPEEESKSDEELESGENGVESSKKDGASEEDEKNGENEKTE